MIRVLLIWSTGVASAVIVLVYAVLVLIVDPRGEFPLDDDWSFALSTWRSAEAGRFVLARFSGMALKTQILWGGLWSRIFGDTFFVLRCSTIFLAALALPMFFAYLRRFVTPRHAALATFALAIHPVFFWSSLTYMTHVPFFFWALLSLLLLERFIRGEGHRFLVAAAGAIVAAYFLRQTGVGIAAGALIGFALAGKLAAFDRWRSGVIAMASIVVLFAAVFLTTDLLIGNREQMSVHAVSWRRGVFLTAADLAVDTFITAARLAMNGFLFSLPIALPFALFGARGDRRYLLTLLLVTPLFLAPAAYVVGAGNAIPRPGFGDVFENVGIGPRTLRDVWTFRLPYPYSLGPAARAAFTYALALGTAVCFTSVIESIRTRWPSLPGSLRTTLLVLTSATVGMVLTVSAGRTYFDRYALDVMWFVIPIMVIFFPWEEKRARRAAAGLVVILGAFVVGGTEEYFNWNRARWRGYEYLRNQGVRLEQMDGGFEVNQYLIGGFNGSPERGKAGMSVIDDEYILSFTRATGYEVVAEFPYRGYFGLTRGTIYAMERRVPFVVR